jgi:hypothetical protein
MDRGHQAVVPAADDYDARHSAALLGAPGTSVRSVGALVLMSQAYPRE